MNIIRERCLLFWSLAGLLAGTGIYLGSRAALGICAGLLLFLLLSTVSARRMAGKTSLKAETAENGFVLTVKCESPAFLTPLAAVKGRVKNLLTGEETLQWKVLGAGGDALMEPSYGSAGKYIFESEAVRICDMTGTFRFSVKDVKARAAFLKKPETFFLDTQSLGGYMLDLDGNVYDEIKPGFDQSEVFEVRQYVPGDRTAFIHWKLSQKTDSLMIRQGSLPVKNAVLILLEGADTTEKIQQAASNFLSLSQSLIQRGIVHHIGFVNETGSRLKIAEISDAQCLAWEMADILSSPLYKGISTTVIYEDERNEWEFSRVITVDYEGAKSTEIKEIY